MKQMSWGQWLRKTLKRRGMTHEQLTVKCNGAITLGALRKQMADTKRKPRLASKAVIEEALGEKYPGGLTK